MPFTSTEAPQPTKVLAAVTIALTVTLVAHSLFVVGAGILLGFSYGACTSPNVPCNYAVGSALFYINPLVSLIAIVSTIVGISVRNRRAKSTWSVPLTAIAAMTALLISNFVLIGWATHTI